MSNQNDDNRRVSEALNNIKAGRKDEELYFDPTSGQLVVRDRGSGQQVSNDAMPATQMAREGFFTS
jgi:hypothetical protein